MIQGGNVEEAINLLLPVEDVTVGEYVLLSMICNSVHTSTGCKKNVRNINTLTYPCNTLLTNTFDISGINVLV